MNKKPLIFCVVLLVLGLLLLFFTGGYLAAAGVGVLVGGAVGTIGGIFLKAKQNREKEYQKKV